MKGTKCSSRELCEVICWFLTHIVLLKEIMLEQANDCKRANDDTMTTTVVSVGLTLLDWPQAAR